MKPCRRTCRHLRQIKLLFLFYLVGFLLGPVKARTQSTATQSTRLTLTQNTLNNSFLLSSLLQRSSNRMTIQHFYGRAAAFLRAQDHLSARRQNVTNHLLIQRRNVWPARLCLKCDFVSELNIMKNYSLCCNELLLSDWRRAASVHGPFELLLSVELMETLTTPLNQTGAVCASVAAGSKG